MFTDKEMFDALVANGWEKISNHDFELKKAIKDEDFDAYLEYQIELNRIKGLSCDFYQIESDGE